MLCGGRSLVKLGDDAGVAVTLRCRAWTCEECAPLRRAQLIHLAECGQPNRLVTLTSNPRVGVSPADRAARLARAWRLVNKRYQRLNKGKRLEYLAVFEATKRGEPHLHILVRGPYIAQRWLSQIMAELEQAPICDVRAIHNARHAAAYVAKYIGKAPHRFATCKRYWHTKNWRAEDTRKTENNPWGDTPWQIDDHPLDQLQQVWEARGWQVTKTHRDEIRYTVPDIVKQYFPMHLPHPHAWERGPPGSARAAPASPAGGAPPRRGEPGSARGAAAAIEL